MTVYSCFARNLYKVRVIPAESMLAKQDWFPINEILSAHRDIVLMRRHFDACAARLDFQSMNRSHLRCMQSMSITKQSMH